MFNVYSQYFSLQNNTLITLIVHYLLKINNLKTKLKKYRLMFLLPLTFPFLLVSVNAGEAKTAVELKIAASCIICGPDTCPDGYVMDKNGKCRPVVWESKVILSKIITIRILNIH